MEHEDPFGGSREAACALIKADIRSSRDLGLTPVERMSRDYGATHKAEAWNRQANEHNLPTIDLRVLKAEVEREAQGSQR